MKRKPLIWCLMLTYLAGGVITSHLTPENSTISGAELKHLASISPDKIPKDCHEYALGELKLVHDHGSTWINGLPNEIACSNCTCDNGDIRCFLHFCDQLPNGFLSVPIPKNVPEIVDDSDYDYESSGDFPHEIDVSENNEDFIKSDKSKESSKNINQSLESNNNQNKSKEAILNFHKVIKPSNEYPDKLKESNENSDKKYEIIKNLDNEKVNKDDILNKHKWIKEFISNATPNIRGDFFSHFLDFMKKSKNREQNETFKNKMKFCDENCKMICENGYERDTQRNCLKCNCCLTKNVACKNSCSFGFEKDASGCRTCKCKINVEEDIVFDDSLEETPKPIEVPAHEKHYRKSSHHSEILEPGCNKTQIRRGCLDGLKETSVGETWFRDDDPCAQCVCAAPGYAVCSSTQCVRVSFCLKKIVPDGQCCPVCEDHKSSIVLFAMIPLALIFTIIALTLGVMRVWRRNRSNKYIIGPYHDGFHAKETDTLNPVLHHDATLLKKNVVKIC